ncbi:hypothetical protein [Brachybacterium huguangmaarense]
MPSTAALPLVRPVHHGPRRESTATSVLRALSTGSMPVVRPEVAARVAAGDDVPLGATRSGAARTGSSAAPEAPDGPGLRSLRLRDLATGGGAATAAWTLAAHLGLLGTAFGTFVVSIGSAILMALAADSLTGARRMLQRWMRSLRERRVHSSRR